MKTFILLVVVCLASTISAFSDYGAYERMWYYYAYTLDPSGSKIAPGCSKSSSSKGPCSFAQFMNYIDQHQPPYIDKETKLPTLVPKEIEKVDPNNLEKAVKALSAGHYTGAYATNLIHPNVKGRDDVSKLMAAVTGFLEGKIDGADEVLKGNLQKATLAVAKARQQAMIKGLKNDLLKKQNIRLVVSQQPLFEGSATNFYELDVAGTATANGLSEDRVESAVHEVQKKDPGHLNNARMAQKGAASVSMACLS